MMLLKGQGFVILDYGAELGFRVVSFWTSSGWQEVNPKP